jgi:hypothetical protein
MAEWKTEEVVKNVRISDCLAFFFTSSYTNFYGVIQPPSPSSSHTLKAISIH